MRWDDLNKRLYRYQPNPGLTDKIEQKLLEEKESRHERVSNLLAIWTHRFPWLAIPVAAATLLLAVGFWLKVPAILQLNPFLSEVDRIELKLEITQSDYRAVVVELEKYVFENRFQLEPRVYAANMTLLANLDESIDACQAALRENPMNITVQQFLISALDDKVKTLNNLVRQIKEMKNENAG